MMEKIWSMGPVACGMYFSEHQMIKNKGRKRHDTFHTLAACVSVQFFFLFFSCSCFTFPGTKTEIASLFSVGCVLQQPVVSIVDEINTDCLACLGVCVGMRWWSVS